mgnify:CR=1 FL=1
MYLKELKIGNVALKNNLIDDDNKKESCTKLQQKINKEIEAGKLEYEAKKPDLQKEIAEKVSGK